MARGRREEPPEQPATGALRTLHLERLRESLAAIPRLKQMRDSRPTEFQTWESRTLQSLGVVFTRDHGYYTEFGGLMFCLPGLSLGGGPSWGAEDAEVFDRDIERAEAILKDALEEVDALDGAGDKSPDQPASSKKGNDVFIVHGHDEPNLYRLRDLVEKRFRLHPVILKWEAGLGRALIQKFEEEASQCGYAFVLLTPDDQIATPDGQYTQARPNVIFELGWFYGRLRRDRVLILLKKGTKLHSDLDGISRIEFSDSVEEKVIDIERELTAAGLRSE